MVMVVNISPRRPLPIPTLGKGLSLTGLSRPTQCHTGSSSDDIVQDKFLVQTYTFDSKSSVPDVNRLSSFWKGLPQGAIKEHRLAIYKTILHCWTCTCTP